MPQPSDVPAPDVEARFDLCLELLDDGIESQRVMAEVVGISLNTLRSTLYNWSQRGNVKAIEIRARSNMRAIGSGGKVSKRVSDLLDESAMLVECGVKTLPDLAARLGVTPHQLSAILNNHRDHADAAYVSRRLVSLAGLHNRMAV